VGVGVVRTKRDVKQNIRVATNNNIVLHGIQVVDGVLLSENDVVLVKDQIDKTLNGVYTVTNSD
jgi:hypothetical protein